MKQKEFRQRLASRANPLSVCSAWPAGATAGPEPWVQKENKIKVNFHQPSLFSGSEAPSFVVNKIGSTHHNNNSSSRTHTYIHAHPVAWWSLVVVSSACREKGTSVARFRCCVWLCAGPRAIGAFQLRQKTANGSRAESKRTLHPAGCVGLPSAMYVCVSVCVCVEWCMETDGWSAACAGSINKNNPDNDQIIERAPKIGLLIWRTAAID